jgi:hypothetical protein
MRRSTTAALSERGYNSASGNPHRAEISAAFVSFQGFARRGRFRRFAPALSFLRTVSRAPVYQIWWVRRFRGHTISGRWFNLFKPLRRHFRATPFAVNLSRRDPGGRIASVQKIDDRLGVSSGSRAAPAACRAVLLGVRGVSLASGTGSRKISPLCEFSRFCRAENFRLDLAADPIIRATGVRPGPEATSPIVSRPDALSARPMRANARRRAGLVAAIWTLSSWVMRQLRDPRGEASQSKDPNVNSFSQKEKPTKIDATRIQRIDFFGPTSVSRDLDASGLQPAAVDP